MWKKALQADNLWKSEMSLLYLFTLRHSPSLKQGTSFCHTTPSPSFLITKLTQFLSINYTQTYLRESDLPIPSTSLESSPH